MHMRSAVNKMSVACLALALSLGAAGCGGGDNANSANASNTANRNAANANTAAANSSNTAIVTGTPAVASSSDDAAIKNKTEANLTKAGVTGVTVEVSGGVVTLKGDVPGAKFQDAVQAANEAGAKRVMNQLNRK